MSQVISFDSKPGADVALARNPVTGKFDLQFDSTNAVMFDDSVSHAVLSLILEHRGRYWADATGQRGSFLYLVKEDRKATPSQMQSYVEDALSLLVDQGKILPLTGESKVRVIATRIHPGRIDINVTYSTPQSSRVNTRATLKY